MDDEGARSPPGPKLKVSSAKNGIEQWWRERVSALALVPLTVWFAASLIVHTGSDYAHFIAWLQSPVVSILMALLLVGTFYHAALGLQVVIEDYVHAGLKTFVVVVVRCGCCGLAVAGVVAILRIAII